MSNERISDCCPDCGCPKEICCGKKERLNTIKEIENIMDKQIEAWDGSGAGQSLCDTKKVLLQYFETKEENQKESVKP